MQRCHINNEAIFHVALDQAIVSLIYVLNGDEFDIRSDVMLAAEIQHFLGFFDTANQGAAETAPTKNQATDIQGKRFGWYSDLGKIAIAF